MGSMMRSDSESVLTREVQEGGGDQGVKRHIDLSLGETSHGLLDKLQIIGDGVQLLANNLGHLLAASASLNASCWSRRLLAGLRHGVEHLGDQLLKIENLDAPDPSGI